MRRRGLRVWLHLPPAGRSGAVAVLPSAQAQVTAATVNRKLAVLEIAAVGGTWLRARAWRAGVRVTVTATVPAGGGEVVP